MSKNGFRFGISTTADYSIDIGSQFRAIVKAGFDFVSIGARMEHSHFFEKDKFSEIIKWAKALNLSIESVHFPFGREYDIAARNQDERQIAQTSAKHFIKLANHYKIPQIILHPHDYYDDSKEACLQRAIESLRDITYRNKAKVHIALENLPGNDSPWIISQLLEKFDRNEFGFCYDSSHENISGEPFHLLKKYHSRMTTTHLSDNLGYHDDHLIPGDGIINWNELSKYFNPDSVIKDILFEVGTGEKLNIPLEEFLTKTMVAAKRIFGN
jgi:sugar phosphate isomerase/epimerase